MAISLFAYIFRHSFENGHPESYLIDLKRTYNRILGHAERFGTEHLTDALITQFLADSSNSRSGEYRYERFLAHNRCIRFLSLIWKQEKYPLISSTSLSKK